MSGWRNAIAVTLADGRTLVVPRSGQLDEREFRDLLRSLVARRMDLERIAAGKIRPEDGELVYCALAVLLELLDGVELEASP